jgi:hypothetical protein
MLSGIHQKTISSRHTALYHRALTAEAVKLTPSLSPDHQIYADLMDEARLRIHAMRDAIAERDHWVPRLLQEFAYLQLRMLCEIIAVGCLVAHGDVKATGTLKLWRPPRHPEKAGGIEC